MKLTLASVGMRAASFCRPSRGPTSTMRTWRGRLGPCATPTLFELEPSSAARRRWPPARRPATQTLGDDPRARRFDDVLHLHRLQHDQRLVLADHARPGDGDLRPHGRASARSLRPAPLASSRRRGVVDARAAVSLEPIAAAVALDDAPLGSVPDRDRLAVDAQPLAPSAGAPAAARASDRPSTSTLTPSPPRSADTRRGVRRGPRGIHAGRLIDAPDPPTACAPATDRRRRGAQEVERRSPRPCACGGTSAEASTMRVLVEERRVQRRRSRKPGAASDRQQQVDVVARRRRSRVRRARRPGVAARLARSAPWAMTLASSES